jgi:hypothetical protein
MNNLPATVALVNTVAAKTDKELDRIENVITQVEPIVTDTSHIVRRAARISKKADTVLSLAQWILWLVLLVVLPLVIYHLWPRNTGSTRRMKK